MDPFPELNLNFSKPKRKVKKLVLSIVLPILFILLALIFYLHLSYPTAYPWVSAQYIVSSWGTSHANLQKKVIGFLPYWRLDDSKYIHYDLLSDVYFFSLSADENGNIVKVINGQTDPGWRWWQSQIIQDLIAKTQIMGDKFTLTIAMQKNKTLENFLDNQTAQRKLVSNLLDIVEANHLNGLNLDFEYDGQPDDKYRAEFTNFSKLLTSEFRQQSSSTQLSIDMFPLSVEQPRLYDVAALAPLFDQVVVMSYDFYATYSDTAGPVAPMTGYKSKYYFDVTTAYQDYLKEVPKSKIIMGIPYYGYDWPVEDGTHIMSKVLPQNDQNGYAEVLSYGRMKTDTDLKPQNCHWDDAAEETWCYYTDANGVSHQVWYEDNKSIGIKETFLKNNGLGGMAIWTLGYDKDYPDLWNLITSNFTN